MPIDPPDLGNEDPDLMALLDLSRFNTARRLPPLIVAAKPPSRDDTDAEAEAKAIAAVRAWAEQRGETLSAVLPQPKPKRKKAS